MDMQIPYFVMNKTIKHHWSHKVSTYLKIGIYGLLIGLFTLPYTSYCNTNNECTNYYIYENSNRLWLTLTLVLILILEFTTPWSTRKWGLRCILLIAFALLSMLFYNRFSNVFQEAVPSYGRYILANLFPILFIYFIFSSIAYYKTKKA